MSQPPSLLICAGCGAQAPGEEHPYPFRCARAQRGDDINHVMRRVLDPARVTFPQGRETNPFLRYRSLLHSYQLAISSGLSDGDYVALVQRLDRDVVRVDGQGFVVTPFTAYDRLGARLGFAPGRLWVKDETGNVSGSHKARHLMGVMLYLQVRQETGDRRREPGRLKAAPTNVRADVAADLGRPEGAVVGAGFRRPALAIASCGNAALAAAVVTRAAGRDLDVFVPTWVDDSVVARLHALGAHLITCPREPGVAGDPCYHRFHEALGQGAIPFCCQGPDNGLTIEGGSTLVWEMIDALGDQPLDRLFVQVGGGALASACAQGFADAARLGRIARLPRLHAVQTRGGFPLKRAYDRVLTRILARLGQSVLVDERAYADLADFVLTRADSASVREEVHYAATHRAEFMWAWETAPHSIATGILDDETYDWLAVVEGMLLSGGYPVVVDEDTLKAANGLGRETTGIDVDHTGTAGLAGLMQALADDARIRDKTVAVIFTGARRE